MKRTLTVQYILLVFVLLYGCGLSSTVLAETIFQIEDYGVKILFAVEEEESQNTYRLELAGLGSSNHIPTIESLDAPRRLVFRVPTTKKIQPFEESLEVLSEIQSIQIAEHDNSIRVVFNLVDSFSPSGNIDSSLKADGSVTLTFSDKSLIVPPASAKSSKSRDLTKAYTVEGNSITTRDVSTDTDFSKTPDNTNPISNPNSLPSLIREEATDVVTSGDNEIMKEHEQLSPNSSTGLIQGLEKDMGDKTGPIQVNAPDQRDVFREADSFNISRLPTVEDVRAYSSFIELLGILLAITFIAVLTLRREELAALLFHKEDALKDDLTLESAESSYTMPYIVLGCKETDSDEAIKARYRHLVKVFHGDRLQSQKLPQEVLELTDKEFQRVQQAYEQLKSMRGL